MIMQYQPIVDIDSGIVVRAEALCRTAEDGAEPAAFFADAEARGTIRDVTTRILDLVGGDRATFGPALALSLNVSEHSLREADFASWFLGVAERAGLEIGAITLELPDGVQGRTDEAERDSMRRLRERGVRFAVDGFGLDLSEWTHVEIEHFGVAELKVHGDLVGHLESPRWRVVMTSVMDVAQRFKLDVVAKNIETTEDLELARSFGCRFAQGFAIARPMDAPTLAEWLGQRTVRRAPHVPPKARQSDAAPHPEGGTSPLESALRFFRRR